MLKKQISDKQNLENYMIGLDLNDEVSIITNYPTYSVVYKWTNENLNIYPNDNLEGKKVLSITASGDHALDAILKGASTIDCIDINVFSKYISSLKIAMIKKYDFYTFYNKYKLFTTSAATVNSLLKILDEISLFLTKDEILFWQTYINCLKNFKDPKLFTRELFWNDGGAFEKNRYSCKNTYNDLKEKLSSTYIKYYDGDINDIDKNFIGSVYDCVYLSNVLEKIKTFDSASDRTQLIKKILNKMNKNGTIYNYQFKSGVIFNKNYNLFELFDIHYDDLRQMFNEEFFVNYEDNCISYDSMVSIIKK